jgi:hypothetical protein
MNRCALAMTFAIIFAWPAVYAHHSYDADFRLDRDATIDGTIESIDFKNPHVVIRLRTSDSTVFTVEWQGAAWLEHKPELVLPIAEPVMKETLHVGDYLLVVGAPAKDPARHELVALKNVKRPTDGWEWSCNIPERRIKCGRGA